MAMVALLGAFAALVFVDVWLSMTVFNALFRTDGGNGLWWAATGLVVALLFVALWLTAKVGRRLRARFASQFIRPS